LIKPAGFWKNPPLVSGYVTHESDVGERREPGDTAAVRLTIGREAGAERLEQRIIRFAPGRSKPRTAGPDRQEILFVASGNGTLHLDGAAHELAPDTGVFVAAGESWEVENPESAELVLVSVTAPQEREPSGERKVTIRFDEQAELRADEKRTFRYLVNQDAGCLDVTQFVGIVQPCRAPDHSHSYDEVGYIIEGEGIAHVGGKQTPIRAGSCFHLPPEHVHCIENNGGAVMRIMGVFHPSGDPASRSYDEARNKLSAASS
jgi:mannose-6-phosphate isomerase-like protein (cupin superfamily)